jgi:hypothetical protein
MGFGLWGASRAGTFASAAGDASIGVGGPTEEARARAWTSTQEADGEWECQGGCVTGGVAVASGFETRGWGGNKVWDSVEWVVEQVVGHLPAWHVN